MLITGVAQLIAAPVAVLLVRRIDERFLTAIGFLLFAIGLGLSSVQTMATDFGEMFWPPAGVRLRHHVLYLAADPACLGPPWKERG